MYVLMGYSNSGRDIGLSHFLTEISCISKARIRQLATEAVDVKIDYESKYAEKLRQRALQEGVKSVEELKARVKTAKSSSTPLQPSNPPLASSTNTGSTSSPTTATSATSPAAAQANQSAPGAPPSSSAPALNKIMKIELLENEDPETIGKIWTECHSTKDCISAVIPGETYKTFFQRSQKYPMFIVPLMQPQGVEFYLLQFSYHQCVFTSLLEYKTRVAQARPYLTLTHYPELLPTKGIVLMRGELSEEPRVLSSADALFLALQMQQFYVSGGERKLKLVEAFHERPEEFDHHVLIEEMARVG
ncbi:ATP11 protein-domain-containing protein [Jimgerdemannia flammicorona]|uniref:ATP11 protein-domain-containing protein n=1 Tax=Jimgerdemannia flammicorona TaxID=994334 RepID=A0A433DMB5_9FUNG|nr:ATP11 protein-domain-containing protein [Jimgerdemannia flammicorona]